MIPSKDRILKLAADTKFDAALLERVIRLLDFLGGMRAHPFLKSRWALKGGTALNLFLLDVPRLSVDIDVNYVGSKDREVMLAERPDFDKALQAVAGRHELAVRRQPEADEHAGGKWSLRYESVLGHGGNLEVDTNYLLRVPLWPPTPLKSKALGEQQASDIPVLDLHELAGGKLAALLSRHAARDLFDAHRMLTKMNLDRAKLRVAFVVYGAMNRKDWRTADAAEVDFDDRELRDELVPLLRADVTEARSSPKAWAKRLVTECREALKAVLPLSAAERKFLDGVLDRGEIDPTLLTGQKDLAQRILEHPGLLWKALNVRQYKGKKGR